MEILILQKTVHLSKIQAPADILNVQSHHILPEGIKTSDSLSESELVPISSKVI